MWLVTCEDHEGMWWDDPIAADTEEEARRIALEKWKDEPQHVAVVLWRCEYAKEIPRPGITQVRAQAK